MNVLLTGGMGYIGSHTAVVPRAPASPARPRRARSAPAHEAARPPEEGRRPGDHPDDAVIGADDDGAVVADDEVSDGAQPPPRVGIVDHQRLAYTWLYVLRSIVITKS